jgi:hypothetical protein
MNPERERAVEFLKRNGMFFGDIDLDGECDTFISEMERGLQGTGDDAGSLEMIPTYIDADREIPRDEPVIAVDAGGTNFRVARVRFDGETTPEIDRYTKHPMPGLDRELTKEEFFRAIVEYLGPVLDTSAKMGICFSYPTEIFPNRDGKLIHFTKEIKAREVEGEFIGKGVRAALRKAGRSAEKSLVLLNDTVATLLAGKSASTTVPYDSYVGFILGTGTNCCYIESNARIRKLRDADAGRSMIINIESGGYDKLPRGDIDRAFDGTLNTPGQFAFEKMVSGAYFGQGCGRRGSPVEAGERPGPPAGHAQHESAQRFLFKPPSFRFSDRCGSGHLPGGRRVSPSPGRLPHRAVGASLRRRTLLRGAQEREGQEPLRTPVHNGGRFRLSRAEIAETPCVPLSQGVSGERQGPLRRFRLRRQRSADRGGDSGPDKQHVMRKGHENHISRGKHGHAERRHRSGPPAIPG